MFRSAVTCRANSRALSIALALALLPAIAIAQDLRPDSIATYGGRYSPDCDEPMAPSIRIATGGLVLTAGKRALRTPVRMDSFTSFGAVPTSPVPPGYRVEFIGDAFSLYVFEDAGGLHVPLTGYTPPAETVFGADAARARFGRCDGG